MNDRPTLTAQSAFEARLTSAFAAYADRAPVEVDAVTLTAKVTRGGAVRRNPFAGARRYLVPLCCSGSCSSPPRRGSHRCR